jgi:hypothetical protein
MTEQSIKSCEENEMGLFDILVTLAESWRLLLLGPIFAGLLAGGVAILLPKTYESLAIVRLSEEEITLIYTTSVLDPLIDKFGYLQEAHGNMDEARRLIKKDLAYSIDKKSKLINIVAKGPTPELAQLLGKTAIAIVLIELQPKGGDKNSILQEIALNNQLIADGVNLLEQRGNKGNDEKTQIAILKIRNLELSRKLQLKGEEVFAQEPSLTQNQVSPRQGLFVIFTLLLSALALSLFVLIRKVWRQAVEDPDVNIKIQKIKKSFGLSA